MLGRGRFLAERQQHRKTAQRLGTEGCQCVRLQTKRDKSRVAMSGQVRRDACESQDDESHERSGIQKATCWSYVTQSGIPYWAATTRLGIAGGEHRGTIVWTIRCSGCLQATNTSTLSCCKGPAGLFAGKCGDLRGFVKLSLYSSAHFAGKCGDL